MANTDNLEDELDKDEEVLGEEADPSDEDLLVEEDVELDEDEDDDDDDELVDEEEV